MEAVECGAAALGILLAYHGRIVALSELRAECGVSRDGSNAANVIRAARRMGFKAKGLSTDLDDARNLKPPFIVFWNFNHFLVVEGIRKDRVFLNDPASGRRTVTLQEFDEGFTGVVLYMEPGDDFEKGGQSPSAFKAVSRRIVGCGRDLALSLVAGLLLVAPGLAVPLFTKLFVDEILVADRFDWLRPLLLGMALIAVLHVALSWLQARYLREMRAKLAIKLSGGFLWHVLRLPVGFFAQRFAGEISSRLTLNHGIADVLSGQLAVAAIDCTMLIFYIAVMLQFSPTLTLVGVGMALINVIALRWIARRRVDANMRLRQESGKLAGVAIAGLQSIETIKASALESGFFSRWAGYFTKSIAARQELGLTNSTLGVLPGLLSSITSATILVLGGWYVMRGELSVGSLIALLSLMASFQRPVGKLVSLGGTMQTLQGDMLRVDDVLLHPVDPETMRSGGAAESARLDGSLELRGVTFGYSRVAPPLVENFSLKLSPGQRVALVGGSGSGKSTIAKLVCGLYSPWEGTILLDGKPREQIPRRVLANSLALVDQEILFFGGSVRDNLTLWDESISDAELEQATRGADVHDVVLSLTGGFDAELAEGGGNLSGGQRQRLEIARALVNQPAVLVLDEATSALDAETEFRIDRHLRSRGCSTLVVAHRLSTIRDSDEIIVLRDGKVVQRGKHEELWESGGEYARLIRSEGEAL